ncbi:MAG: LacI family transcriptional regulator [Treponema sp.]|nr:LacI family transcriptional regulator [Treponema sp.]
MITLKEISQRCNVSIATVSNIMNGKSNVSEETKERVMAVVKETGYIPNYMARGLRASKSKTIGMIVDDITAFGSPRIIEGIMEVCEDNDYRAILSNLRIYSKWMHKEQKPDDFTNLVNSTIQELLSIKVDGIIYVGAYTREIDFLPTDSIPFSIAYSTSKNEVIPSVCIDDVTSAYNLTNYLISHNHRKIAVISGPSGASHSELRLKGYKQALLENSIPFDDTMIFSAKWDTQSAYKTCQNINLSNLVKSKKISALFCFNDLMAAGVYAYLQDNNLKPGEDLSIVGFDNRECAEILSPQLTTMGIKLLQIGQKSAEILFKQIKGEEVTPKSYKMNCQLYERQSVVTNNLQ